MAGEVEPRYLCSVCLELLGVDESMKVTLPGSLPTDTLATLSDQQVHHDDSLKPTGADDPNSYSDSESVDDPAVHNQSSKLTPAVSPVPNADPHSKKRRLSDSLAQRSPVQVCVCCLGIASERFIQKTFDTIMEAFYKEHYVGLKSFNLAVNAPLSALIRKTGVCAYLKSLHKDVVSLEDTFVKEHFKKKLRSLLKENLSLSYEIEGQLQIEVKIDHGNSKHECELLCQILPSAFSVEKISWKMRKQHPKKSKVKVLNVNGVSVRKALEELQHEALRKHCFLVPEVQAECHCDIEFFRRPVFVAGRYNKYSRELPQTPWFVEGMRKGESSVQELITDKIMECVRATDLKFSSSGREDCDVRMLGAGRPFLVELIQPKTFELTEKELLKLQEDINTSSKAVAVRQLKVVSKDSGVLLKQGEQEKRKLYSALIWTSQVITPQAINVLSEMKDLEIAQKTPIRVLHRRTLATRVRTVYSMHAEYIDEHHFNLSLTTQAGTYIKEFVHSDFGRTEPSLCDLMKQEVDILTLDVNEVKIDWPPL